MSETPRLRELGANTRSSAKTITLDVSNTIGPDYRNQETVDVDGHWANRPGVQSRFPETSIGADGEPDRRVKEMDTGEELPVLLSSNMRADPCEGVQGTYSQIVTGECARCGYDRLTESVQTLAGERRQTCNACGAEQSPHDENGYRMPRTYQQKLDTLREHNELCGRCRMGDVYTLDDRSIEVDTGNRLEYFPIENIIELYKLLARNGKTDR